VLTVPDPWSTHGDQVPPSRPEGTAEVMSAPSPGPSRVRVLYGSETGNSRQVSAELVDALRARDIEVECSVLDDATPEALLAERTVLVVTATTGDGDMPYNADRFWVALSGEAAPRLDGVDFAVLGLGDSGYFDFCQAAKDLDGRFDALGARRVRELTLCDDDYESDAAAWTTAVVDQLAGAGAGAGTTADDAARPGPADHRRPHDATVLRSHRITGTGSLKDVLHLELCLDGSGISYSVGDSIAVVPSNDPGLVRTVLGALGATGDEPAPGDPTRTLHDALTSDYEISRPSRELVEEVARRTDDPELPRLLDGGHRRELHEYLWARDVLDLLALARLTPGEVLALLRPLAHRSYSIASSPLTDPNRVDLTVATLRYRAGGRDRFGVASVHLADRLTEGDTVGVFLEPNELFRPPADDVPMIMIGPGTGVAPFRGFLHERRIRGATGANWLFFGGRHRRCDALYGEELAGMAADGLLHRLDLAFSRDQPEKVYVQTRMREQGAELYRWLADGAHLYVCGDAERMAGDVDAALHEIVAHHGGLSADDAAHFVTALKNEQRYVRDVY
jgi:sulfite reductase (NADPH) flavoprotein alpha-component